MISPATSPPAPSQRVISPQPGPQTDYMATSADIALYGGAAGGGKTWALLAEPLRHIFTTPGYGAVIFRRTMPQIMAEGGLWDQALDLYISLGARQRESTQYLDFTFPPYGNSIKFAHMQHDKDRENWATSQIPYIAFDQLEQFTRKQFLFMLSRSRSLCGVAPIVRGGYNPVPADDRPGGWLHDFVGWYLTEEGYPDPSRAGVIRWLINDGQALHWYASRAEARAAWPDRLPLSFTFVPASLYDNQILMTADPLYLAKLQAMDLIEQERLLHSNHKIRPAAGKVFNRAWFNVVQGRPTDPEGQPLQPLAIVRYWDLAATEKKQATAATASVKMEKYLYPDGGYRYLISHATEDFMGPAGIDSLITSLAQADGLRVRVRWEQEGGSAGKRDAAHISRLLPRHDARAIPSTGDKLTRSRPMAAQALAGNIDILAGPWVDMLLNHLHQIPEGARWDLHDAAAGAYNALASLVISQIY